MAISVLSAAKFIGQSSGWSMWNLHMQKLLYIAHMFHLGQHDGEPLLEGHFEAWDYGPVHPVLYRKAKVFGADPVRNIFRSFPEVKDGSEKETLEVALEGLKDCSGAKLVAITHRDEGAWAKHYAPGGCGTIPNEDIIEEYRDLFGSEIPHPQ